MRIAALRLLVAGLVVAMLQPVPASGRLVEPRMNGKARACPADLNAVASCYWGQDANGAFYLAAVPKQWNGILIVHAHGGPRLEQPKADDADEDLARFQSMVQQGYAWVGSTYRRGGYGVRMAAADVDNSRAHFWKRFGKPRLTILHGQSYGGNVAAKLAELGAVDAEGSRLFDGVMLTNAVLWGGSRAYGFRADLRAVYQYYCRNHPRPGEPQYSVWEGLARASALSRKELEARVNECTGLDQPIQSRSTEQNSRLQAISSVTQIAEDQILKHLEWATFHFRDIVHYRLGGRNPFDNSQTIYKGSNDDSALNEGIERFSADPQAVANLAYDSDLTGLILLPTVALHWQKDPTVSADAGKFYEAKIASQGGADRFVRIAAGEGTHSKLLNADLLATLDALVNWIETSKKASHAQVQNACIEWARKLKSKCSIE